MVDRDVAPEPKLLNFEDVADAISKLVPANIVGSSDVNGDEVEFPGWDGSVRKLDLEPEVASQAGLGSSVRARVIGDYESGIAIIMRSRNLFDTRRYGFYIQPRDNEEELRSFEVWQAPAQKPKRGELYWGFELLDREQARPSSPEVSRGFIDSLQQKVQ